MAKFKGRQSLNKGKLTLQKYLLNNFSILPRFVQIFKTIHRKLYQEFRDTKLHKCLETYGYGRRQTIFNPGRVDSSKIHFVQFHHIASLCSNFQNNSSTTVEGFCNKNCFAHVYKKWPV